MSSALVVPPPPPPPPPLSLLFPLPLPSCPDLLTLSLTRIEAVDEPWGDQGNDAVCVSECDFGRFVLTTWLGPREHLGCLQQNVRRAPYVSGSAKSFLSLMPPGMESLSLSTDPFKSAISIVVRVPRWHIQVSDQFW